MGEQATRRALDNTAITVLSLAEMESWPGWVVYLLEKLESMDANAEPGLDYGPGDVDFEWVLEQVRDSITARLEDGQW